MKNNDDFLTAEHIEAGTQELCEILAEIDDKVLMRDFFECLFTPNERIDIIKRWLLVKELDKGTTQRSIAQRFKMSLCKITRGSRELQKETSAFRKVLDRDF